MNRLAGLLLMLLLFATTAKASNVYETYMFANGHFNPGTHDSHREPGDENGIPGNKLADGKILYGNIIGQDDVYKTSDPKTFVQFYCSLGEPTLPDGQGIETIWQVVDTCPNPGTLKVGQVCVPNACNWNIPSYASCSTLNCCKPAIATNSAYIECHPRCGDGAVQKDEQCDDGNRTDNDGCSSNCQLEEKIGTCNDQPIEVCNQVGKCANQPIDVSKHVGICNDQPVNVPDNIGLCPTQSPICNPPAVVIGDNIGVCPTKPTSCPQETPDSFYAKCPQYFRGEVGKPIWNCAKIEGLPMKGRRAKNDAAEICGALVADCIKHGIHQ